METYSEFSFDAAHATPPFSGLHGHTFYVRVSYGGVPDPVYGWSHNLEAIGRSLAEIRQQLDSGYLNEIEGLAVPSLENLCIWIWKRADASIAGVQSVAVHRGLPGASEGCIYSPLRESPSAVAGATT